MRQVQRYLPLQSFLGLAGLERAEHEVVGAEEAPMQFAVGEHILFLDVVGVVRLEEVNEVIATSRRALTRLHILVVVATAASHNWHGLVIGV